MLKLLGILYARQIRNVLCETLRRAGCGGGSFQHIVRTLIQIALIRSSPNLIRRCILMISRSSSNMGHAGSKTRSQSDLVHFKHLGSCPDSNSNSVDPIFTKPGQKLYLDDI